MCQFLSVYVKIFWSYLIVFSVAAQRRCESTLGVLWRNVNARVTCGMAFSAHWRVAWLRQFSLSDVLLILWTVEMAERIELKFEMEGRLYLSCNFIQNSAFCCFYCFFVMSQVLSNQSECCKLLRTLTVLVAYNGKKLHVFRVNISVRLPINFSQIIQINYTDNYLVINN